MQDERAAPKVPATASLSVAPEPRGTPCASSTLVCTPTCVPASPQADRDNGHAKGRRARRRRRQDRNQDVDACCCRSRRRYPMHGPLRYGRAVIPIRCDGSGRSDKPAGRGRTSRTDLRSRECLHVRWCRRQKALPCAQSMPCWLPPFKRDAVPLECAARSGGGPFEMNLCRTGLLTK